MESLTPAEARVVGCLVEKQRTVPDAYPLTLHALVAACNQSSNREPVVDYDEHTVLAAVDGLKAKGAARMVHPATGQRVTKYRHVLDEALGLDDAALALVAVLLLRGAQTAAELRSRTERLHAFPDGAAVDAALDALATRDLVVRLDRRPGEREVRWRQLLATEPEGVAPEEVRPATPATVGLEERVAKLEEEVALLRQALLE